MATEDYRYWAKVLKTFALDGQGMFAKGSTIEVVVARQSPVAVMHPVKFEKLLESKHIDVIPADDEGRIEEQ